MPNHRGRSRNLTPENLKKLLAIPLYYLITGKAQVAYPNTSTPAPSSFVKIIRTGRVERGHEAYFPIYLGWQQWNEVVVPVINNGNYASWLGLLGGTLGETDNDDALPTQLPESRVQSPLYAQNPMEMILLLGEDLKTQAEDEGYGTV